nr:hypothetical protein GCM10020063_056310 [Dactylosporangium thailandense]
MLRHRGDEARLERSAGLARRRDVVREVAARLFRAEYSGATLREHLGLARPAPLPGRVPGQQG